MNSGLVLTSARCFGAASIEVSLQNINSTAFGCPAHTKVAQRIFLQRMRFYACIIGNRGQIKPPCQSVDWPQPNDDQLHSIPDQLHSINRAQFCRCTHTDRTGPRFDSTPNGPISPRSRWPISTTQMRLRSQAPPARPRPTSGGRPGLNLLLCHLLALLPTAADAATVNVELNITHGFRAPDGVERLVILGAQHVAVLA